MQRADSDATVAASKLFSTRVLGSRLSVDSATSPRIPPRSVLYRARGEYSMSGGSTGQGSLLRG
jgi:hypothetical protein